MKIVQIIDKLTVGGAQRLLITFAREVQHRDVDLTVVVLWSNPRQTLVDELERVGARVTIMPATRSTDLKRLSQLIRFFRHERFDVICTHLFQAGILGAILGKVTNTPVVSILHNISMPNGNLRSRVWRSMIRRGSSRVVAVGAMVAEAHQNWLLPTSCDVLPNPVEPIESLSAATRAEIRSELLGSHGDTLVLSVGIVSPQKAYVDLVEAISELCKKNNRIVLAIVGGGRDHNVAVVKAKIDELGLGDNVILLGMRDDVQMLLGAADLFVSSSHWEGLPIAVLEAMAAGLPIVATSVGDVPRAVVEGTGLLVPPAQPEALRGAIRQLLDNPELRVEFGEAAKRFVTQHHDPTVWVDRQLALFSDAIADMG